MTSPDERLGKALMLLALSAAFSVCVVLYVVFG